VYIVKNPPIAAPIYYVRRRKECLNDIVALAHDVRRQHYASRDGPLLRSLWRDSRPSEKEKQVGNVGMEREKKKIVVS
jgi:hypothetical protein